MHCASEVNQLQSEPVGMASGATGSPLHLEELAERRRPAAVLQVAPEAEREQKRSEPAAPARPRARAAPALHGVHEADQARQRHAAAAAAARQGPRRLHLSTDSHSKINVRSRYALRCSKLCNCAIRNLPLCRNQSTARTKWSGRR